MNLSILVARNCRNGDYKCV